MFKNLLGNMKSAVVTLWDEVNDEQDLLTTFCYLTVTDTSLSYFSANEEIKITFEEECLNLETAGEDGFISEVPCSSIVEIAYKNEMINGALFKGSYMRFESEEGMEYIYLKAATTEPHFFLECVQRLRIIEELNDKRYSRTAKPIKQLCEGCGAVIQEANCSHCGYMNPMEQDTIGESSYEYFVEPQYRVILQLHSSSLHGLSENDRVFYHVYEDCVVLRVRGTDKSYVPINIVILFENMLSYSLKPYGPNNESGLYISYKDNGTQFVQLKVLSSDPKAPLANLEYHKSAFKLEDVVAQIHVPEGELKHICDYCGLAISTQICPHCGGVN